MIMITLMLIMIMDMLTVIKGALMCMLIINVVTALMRTQSTLDDCCGFNCLTYQLARLLDLDLRGAFKTMSPNFVLSHLRASQLFERSALQPELQPVKQPNDQPTNRPTLPA